jgi:hypothetical protein
MPRSFNQLLETLSHDDKCDLSIALLSDLPLADRVRSVLHSFSPADQQELAAWLTGEDQDSTEEEEDDTEPENKPD